MKLDDTPDAPARMVFGCRSCDARGFAVLDKPFLEGKFQDAYYKARRDNLLVVTRTCDSPVQHLLLPLDRRRPRRSHRLRRAAHGRERRLRA